MGDPEKTWRYAIKKRGRCYVWATEFTKIEAALAYWKWRAAGVKFYYCSGRKALQHD